MAEADSINSDQASSDQLSSDQVSSQALKVLGSNNMDEAELRRLMKRRVRNLLIVMALLVIGGALPTMYLVYTAAGPAIPGIGDNPERMDRFAQERIARSIALDDLQAWAVDLIGTERVAGVVPPSLSPKALTQFALDVQLVEEPGRHVKLDFGTQDRRYTLHIGEADFVYEPRVEAGIETEAGIGTEDVFKWRPGFYAVHH